jgi:NitT/TauT family transport system substrate-binding protein
MNRLSHRLIGLFALLALVLTACQAPTTPGGSSSSPTTATIGLTFIPNIQFAPFYVGDQQADFGSGIELRHHGSSEGLFTALTTGTEQFVVAGGDEILQARAQGVDVVAVAPYYRSYPARVLVPANSPIQQLSDLAGHSIGLPGRYGESWFALVLALQSAGLSQTDVTISEIGYTQLAALTSGQVDATIGFSNGDAVNFTAAGFPVRQIDPAVPLVSACLATTGQFAKDHPETVRQVVAGLSQAIDRVLADPALALTVAADYIPDFQPSQQSASQVLTATLPLWQSAGQPGFDLTAWTVMAEAMTAADLLPGPVEAEQAVTNLYLS